MLGFVLLIMTLKVMLMMHRGVLHFGSLSLIRAVKYWTGTCSNTVQFVLSLIVVCSNNVFFVYQYLLLPVDQNV